MATTRPPSTFVSTLAAIALTVAVGILAVAIRGPAVHALPAAPRYSSAAARVEGITATKGVSLFLPVTLKHWPPVPYDPIIKPVNNADQDSAYQVEWAAAGLAAEYVLDESSDPRFERVKTVYQGTELKWSVRDPGKTPGTYYYRVRALNNWGSSRWSGAAAVTIHPLFVGARQRYDGIGQLRGSQSVDWGWHMEHTVTGLVDADSVNVHGSLWYDPNPLAFDGSTWDSYYALPSSEYESTPGGNDPDPTVLWGYSWIAPTTAQFADGQTILVNGQPFSVSGLHAQSAFNRTIEYWQLINQTKILNWHDGDWKSYIHPGQAILWFDVANSRFLVHDDVTYTYYKKDKQTRDTERDIGDLTSSNTFPPPSLLSPSVAGRAPTTTVRWSAVPASARARTIGRPAHPGAAAAAVVGGR